MRFLCDQMLGTLAKWLRLMGFDTFYASSEIKDDELLRIAEEEDRLLVTRDKQLVSRAEKKGLKVIKVDTTNLEEQLELVLKKSNTSIKGEDVLSRCSKCNTILIKIAREKVEGKVPPRVFEQHREFWFCPRCKKIYWAGSHYDNIRETIHKLQETLS